MTYQPRTLNRYKIRARVTEVREYLVDAASQEEAEENFDTCNPDRVLDVDDVRVQSVEDVTPDPRVP